MTRVSENSSTAALKFAVNKTKAKLEDLQIKGSNLKAITKPSDHPVNSVESLAITSIHSDNKQFMRNAEFAVLQLSITEQSIEQLTDLLSKAKEIAIAQSSDFYNDKIRQNVSNEIIQLKNHALAIANKRIGSKYIFAGHKTLTKPFNINGEYFGDKSDITLEVAKDFFVPINLNGSDVFYTSENSSNGIQHPLEKFPDVKPPSINEENNLQEEEETAPIGRGLASIEQTEKDFHSRENLFSLLTTLISSLENNDPKIIQNTLEKFDDTISRLITLRTRIGSRLSSIENAQDAMGLENINHLDRKSVLIDADLAELFTDLTKQQQILKTTYHASNGIMNKTLLDFLR